MLVEILLELIFGRKLQPLNGMEDQVVAITYQTRLNNLLTLCSFKMKIFLTILLVINVFFFFLMCFDKYRAQHGRWRVRERTFFIGAFFFGAAGVLLGMFALRHKTQHPKFVWGMPFLLFTNMISVIWLVKSFK